MSKWISVLENTPKDQQIVVGLGRKNRPEIVVCFIDKNDYVFMDTNLRYQIKGIKCWMPLPAPPEVIKVCDSCKEDWRYSYSDYCIHCVDTKSPLPVGVTIFNPIPKKYTSLSCLCHEEGHELPEDGCRWCGRKDE